MNFNIQSLKAYNQGNRSAVKNIRKKLVIVSTSFFLTISLNSVLDHIQNMSFFICKYFNISLFFVLDIIICNSPDGKPLPIGNVFSSETFGVLRKPPDSSHWIVLVIAGRNGLIKNSGLPTGPFLSKVRDLQALGFHAALVKNIDLLLLICTYSITLYCTKTHECNIEHYLSLKGISSI